MMFYGHGGANRTVKRQPEVYAVKAVMLGVKDKKL